MTAKEYLESPRELDRKINQKLRLLESYKDLAGSISSPNFDEKVQGTRSTDPPFVKYLGKIDELQREIDADIDRLADLKAEIENKIEELPDAGEQAVLRYKYLMFLSIREISAKMHYSRTWIKDTTARAVGNFEKSVQEWLSSATCG